MHPVFSHQRMWWRHCCHCNPGRHQVNIYLWLALSLSPSFPVSSFLSKLFSSLASDQELVIYFQYFACVLTPISFGLDQSSATHMGLLPRTADRTGSKHTKSESLLLHCCSGGTVQSNKYWRLVPGCPRPLSIFEMSSTSIWTPFPSSLCWQLKKWCSTLALIAPV